MVSPTFVTLCGWFEPMNSSDPGPTRVSLPFWNASSVPSRITISSSFAWVCGACVVLPAGSAVTWISSSSSVAVGARSTERDMPLVPVGFAWISSQVIANEPWTACCADVSGAVAASAAASAGAKSGLIIARTSSVGAKDIPTTRLE